MDPFQQMNPMSTFMTLVGLGNPLDPVDPEDEWSPMSMERMRSLNLIPDLMTVFRSNSFYPLLDDKNQFEGWAYTPMPQFGWSAFESTGSDLYDYRLHFSVKKRIIDRAVLVVQRRWRKKRAAWVAYCWEIFNGLSLLPDVVDAAIIPYL